MADTLQVFVSSTFNDLRREREYVKMTLLELGWEPRLFPEHSVPGESVTGFMQQLRDCDILVYIATEQSEWVERELEIADSMGLPILELAPLRGLDKTASEVAVRRRGRASTYQATYDSLAELAEAVRLGISSIVKRRFDAFSSIRPLGDDTYYTARAYVEQAYDRLAIVQTTSTLILGPRRDRLSEEAQYLNELYRRMERIISGVDERLVFVHQFDLSHTLKELTQAPDLYPEAESAIAWLERHIEELNANDRIQIAGMQDRQTPQILQDTTMALALEHADQVLWLENREVGQASRRIWDRITNQHVRGVGLIGFLPGARDAHTAASGTKEVVLLGPSLEVIGREEKISAHVGRGMRHLAISVFVFDPDGRLLIQQRAKSKYHFALRWANTCCSHPPSFDEALEYAQSRLQYEMGIGVELRQVGSFDYREEDPASRLIEDEHDLVFVGVTDQPTADPNPHEVAEYRWMPVEELRRDMSQRPSSYVPWLDAGLKVATAGAKLPAS